MPRSRLADRQQFLTLKPYTDIMRSPGFLSVLGWGATSHASLDATAALLALLFLQGRFVSIEQILMETSLAPIGGRWGQLRRARRVRVRTEIPVKSARQALSLARNAPYHQEASESIS